MILNKRIKPALIILIVHIIFLHELKAQLLTTQTSNIFSGSGNCAVCHEPDAPNSSALLNSNGDDISPVTLWRSTMMANSARDPFWQAKVSAEVTAHPEYKEFIEDKCITCHSPIGSTEAHFSGQENYSLLEMQQDPLALDGVSCTACHQIKEENMGMPESWSGNYLIENDRIIYGPFENPLANPMIMSVNYTPQFSSHNLDSELCATCHTLFTPTLDNDGNEVGEIAEQTPYLEWKNSIYAEQNITCQICHMPDEPGLVAMSNRPPWLSGRENYAKHIFVGANVFMLNLLKNNSEAIGVTATNEQFDSTIAQTLKLLQQNTANLKASYNFNTEKELEINVSVENLSGHKFPTAYPSRRAWIQLELFDSENQLVFSSGNWNMETGEIIGLVDPYEVHHDVITQEDQVQIYQALMHDVDNNVTYTLLRGAKYIKDNRLPPKGFKTSGEYYDSTKISGTAEIDPNFNRNLSGEGTGIDSIKYKISDVPESSSYKINIKLLYQSLAPRFAEDLFQYDTPEINTFKSFYDESDKSPVVIDSLNIEIAVSDLDSELKGSINSYKLHDSYPNPFNPSTTIQFEIPKNEFVSLTIFNALGKEIQQIVSEYRSAGIYKVEFVPENLSSGVYYYSLNAGKFNQIKKTLFLK